MYRSFCLLIFLALLLPLTAEADLFQYEDEQGTVHFTDDPATIPKRLKKKTKTRAEETADTTSRATSVRIKGNQVLVPVTIAYRGREVQATFLLDTGASSCTISPALAAKLAVNQRDGLSGIAQVVGGEKIPVSLITLDSLSVGPKRKYDLQAAVIPSGDNDGLLGMNFLREIRYHVDFNLGAITWGE